MNGDQIMYTVTGKPGSAKRIIQFPCPACRTAIKSPLHEAGQKFPCPACSVPFVTPGKPELEQQKLAEDAEKERQRRSQREEEEKAMLDYERKATVQSLRSQAESQQDAESVRLASVLSAAKNNPLMRTPSFLHGTPELLILVGILIIIGTLFAGPHEVPELLVCLMLQVAGWFMLVIALLIKIGFGLRRIAIILLATAKN